jgi:hypothetical protein
VSLYAAATAAPSFAQSAGGCQLQGTAKLSGLNSTSKPFTYSFGGALSGCTGTAAAPATGTVSAGQVVTILGVQYQEPIPSGTGSCASSTTGGTAIATWADGTQTVISYTTTGAAAAVQLQGKVAPSVTLTAVPPATGTTTVTTTRNSGESAGGVLAFQPPDPTACNTSAGVTTAGISGGVGFEG